MSDHFYSFKAVGEGLRRNAPDITVATSAQSANPIEVRVTDGVMTSRQVYAALEFLADLFVRKESGQVIVPGTLIG